MNTRRQFLITAPLGFLIAAEACRDAGPSPASTQTPVPTPGAPPTFGTGQGVGPEITATTFAEAEKLMQVTLTAAEREQAASSWRTSMAPYLERRTGPRRLALGAGDVPGAVWEPALPGPPPAGVPRPILQGRRPGP